MGVKDWLGQKKACGRGVWRSSAAKNRVALGLERLEERDTPSASGLPSLHALPQPPFPTDVQAGAPTSTTLSTTNQTAVARTPLTFTATVESPVANVLPLTGSVVFMDRGHVLGTVPLSRNAATFSTSLGAGFHSITALYSGDPHFAASTSQVLPEQVAPDPTVTTLGSSVPAGLFGQPVTLTASVAASPAVAGVPTGLVTFMEGTSTLGTQMLRDGTATLDHVFFGPGRHQLSAVFLGGGDFASSASAVFTETVKASTLTYLAAPPTVAVNQPLTLTATVLATSPTTHEPAGYVVFKDGELVLGTVKLNDHQQATLRFSKLSVGRHVIKAYYEGDGNFGVSTSHALGVHVLDVL